MACLVQDALLHFDRERYRMHAWAIMPTHVHSLFTPLPGWSLSQLVHSWKSFTAKEANKHLGLTGEFWHPEYFDRLVRDERHFKSAVTYIEYNPVKAGLCLAAEDWPFSSASKRAAGGTPAIPGERQSV